MTVYAYYQVDAFTDEPFRGNPAAVMQLDAWLPDGVLAQIAAEHNLAETAFLVRRAPGHYDLRWFTPTVEVPLCGHATLASAHTLFTELGEAMDRLTFETQSGPLYVERHGSGYRMDLPASTVRPLPLDDKVTLALGQAPTELWVGQFLLAVFESEAAIRALTPDLAAVEALGQHLETAELCAAAPGDTVDFVSRFFAPSIGIPEDPFTGGAHTMLTPFWAERLGRTELTAHQASARGGDAVCHLSGDRVFLFGNAVTTIRGQMAF
ncbi:MAG: PhzF family phenazine biosynthesis protein [Pseudomonadota bacterium]